MRQCTKTESIDCRRMAEADYQIAQLENEIALLRLEKGGISEGYSRVKAELDLRKGLKPGHTIVQDKPDMDYPNGNVTTRIGWDEPLRVLLRESKASQVEAELLIQAFARKSAILYCPPNETLYGHWVCALCCRWWWTKEAALDQSSHVLGCLWRRTCEHVAAHEGE